MAIAVTNKDSGGGAGVSSITTASITPVVDRLYLVSVWNYFASGTPNEPTVSGDGLTFVKIATALQGVNRVTIFRAMKSSGLSSGALTISYGGQTQDITNYSVDEVTGMVTTGTDGSGAIVQSATGTQASGTSVSATLSAFANANNYGFLAAGTIGDAITIESGWTLTAAFNRMVSGYKTSQDTSPSATWTGTAVGALVGVELASGSVTYTKTGTVTADNSKLSGADVFTATETGAGVIGNSILSGPDSFNFTIKTGVVISAGVLAGTDVEERARSGLVIISGSALSGGSGAAHPFVQGIIGPPIRPEMRMILVRAGGQGPLEITPIQNTLRFSTLAVGGFGSCSFQLEGPPIRWRREVPYLSMLYVMLGTTVIYEGQIEDMAMTLSQGALTTTVTAFGLQRRLDETSVLRIWSKRDLIFQDIPWEHTPAWDFQQGQVDPTDPTKSGVRYNGLGTQGTNANEDRVCVFWLPSGVDAMTFACYFTLSGGGSHGGCLEYYSGGTRTLIDTGTNFNGSGRRSINNLPTPNDGFCVGVRNRSGGNYTPTRLDYVMFYSMRLLCTSITEDETATDFAEGIYGGKLLTDLLTLIPDLTAGTIESGSDFAVPQLTRDRRGDARGVVNEVASYYSREWGVWEAGRFDWKTPNLDEPQWIVTLDQLADLNLTGSIDNIVKTIYLSYLDPTSPSPAEQTSASTDQRNPYVRSAGSKDQIVDPGFPMTSVTASKLATKLAADRGTGPIVTGTVTLPARAFVRHSRLGLTAAVLIRGGQNLVIPQLPKTDPSLGGQDNETLFHIVSTTYDETRDTITLDLEGYTRRADALLARLAAATRVVTG